MVMSERITEQVMFVGPISFETYMGPYEYEKTVKQRVLVSLEITLDTPEIPRTLDNWFNWMPVYQKIMSDFSEQHFNVHGELSLAIAREAFLLGGIEKLVVTTNKPDLVYNIDATGMRITYLSSDFT